MHVPSLPFKEFKQKNMQRPVPSEGNRPIRPMQSATRGAQRPVMRPQRPLGPRPQATGQPPMQPNSPPSDTTRPPMANRLTMPTQRPRPPMAGQRPRPQRPQAAPLEPAQRPGRPQRPNNPISSPPRPSNSPRVNPTFASRPPVQQNPAIPQRPVQQPPMQPPPQMPQRPFHQPPMQQPSQRPPMQQPSMQQPPMQPPMQQPPQMQPPHHQPPPMDHPPLQRRPSIPTTPNQFIPPAFNSNIQLTSNSSHLPVVLYIQPFTSPYTEASHILRCRRCRTYLNCYCTIQDNRWHCNVCYLYNAIDTPIDAIMQSNAVDYLAPQEYMVRPPMPTTFVFVTDQVDIIRRLPLYLPQLPDSQQRLKWHVIFIGKTIQCITHHGIYDLVDMDMCLPRDQLLMSIHDPIPFDDLILQPNTTPIDLDPIYAYCVSLLQPIGGTIITICKEATCSQQKALALDMSRYHIGCDVFSKSPLHLICRYTGGQYHPYLPNHAFLMDYLKQPLGLEAVLRIRCTNGFSASNYYGQFFTRSSDLLALANVHHHHSYMVEFDLEEHTDNAVFQCALLHTTSEGERRIRVLTIQMTMHTAIDPLLLVMWMARRTVDLKETVPQIRQMILAKLIDILKKIGINKDLIRLTLGLIKTFTKSDAYYWMNKGLFEMQVRPWVMNTKAPFEARQILPPSAAYLEHDQSYLIMSGLSCYVLICRDAEWDNQGYLDQVMAFYREMGMVQPQVHIVREQDAKRIECMMLLVDDKTGKTQTVESWSYGMLERYCMDQLK